MPQQFTRVPVESYNSTTQRPRGSAPMVARMPREMVASSDYELVHKITNEYSNAWQAHRWEKEALFTAWKYFFGAEGEQWDQDARKYKQELEQRIAQYNIIKGKVNVFAGMLIADEYDFKYDPIDGIRTSGIEALENAYFCDKEMCNFDYHYNLMIQDGCIHLGILEVGITREYDYRGNIYFKRALPGRWVIDPYWKTDDDSQCEKAWKQGHMTIKQLKETFKSLPPSPRLDSEQNRILQSGMDFTAPSPDEYNDAFPQMRNAYHVIESHWVESINKKRILARNDFGQWVTFPITNDNERLELFARENFVSDWSEGNAHTVPYIDKIHHSAIICPELWPDKLLENGKPEIQIKGLPIIQFTLKRDIIGRNSGMVSDLIDPQKDINYSQSKIWELLANALGGAKVYDKRKLPDEREQEDFEKNSNDVTRSFGIDGDVGSFFTHLSDAQVNPELVRKTSEPFDYADRISQVSAAMSSQTQGSSEPASLYAMKLKVNKVGTLTVDKRVKRVRERMSEAYYNQSQVSYAGAERVFSSKDGKKYAVLNEDMGNGQVRNKVDELPRVSVSISESPNNLTKQLRDRAEISEIIQSIPPDYKEAAAIAYAELFRTTSISEDKKEAINEALMLEQIKARLESIAQIANTEAATKQGELMALQTGAQIEKVVGMLNKMQQAPPETPDMVSEGTPEGPPPEQISQASPEQQPEEAPFNDMEVPYQLSPTM